MIHFRSKIMAIVTVVMVSAVPLGCTKQTTTDEAQAMVDEMNASSAEIERQSGVDNSATAALPNEPESTTATITTVGPAGETVVLNLLPSGSTKVVSQLAQFIRESGYACSKTVNANQLQQQDGKSVDIFKVDCADGNSYQVTVFSGKSYIKPWTGNIIGR